MRDVMRDLALGILSLDAEGCQFLLRTYSKPLKPENRSSSTSADGQYISRVAAGLTELPREEEWEQSKMMFLMNNKLSALPDKPNCPKLVTLFLQRNYQLRVLPDLFFHNMRVLKLLNLSKTRIKYLPKSISNLERLETLILRDCEHLVKLPSEVGSLKLLQVLDLGGTEIIELPEEIAELDSLSHLEVSFYGSSTNSEHAKLPPKLISRLEALETLSISVYPGDKWWNKSVESVVEEVIKLQLLTSLSFYFPEVKFLELFLGESASWKEESLTEFKFVVGADVEFNASRDPQYVELNYGLISGQCLRFVNSEKIPNAIVNVLARCTAFYLDHHLDVHRLCEFGIGNIKKLKYCIISECPDLETIVDSEEGTESVFPCLEHLSIHYSWSLTSIWKGVVPNGSFAALRTLSLHACPKLTYVFKSSMLQFISNLEELQVDDCEAMEKIISAEEVTESCCISLKSLTLQYLPELVHIWEDAQTRLLFEYISVYDCPQLKQICKDSELKQTLKEIRAEKDWWDELVWEENGIRSHFEAIFTPIGESDVHSS
ncbi:disease resistance protein At4g27190-like [Durio zibethinus]|uniref:Disease resistance protein At4g27190-like n=1 Tax=Durio zibethinus TaxID=66656 RepID=A0A6P6A9U2_DURZI|nr:disease resistance protein At4g27190-like [Durio zibethinus]